MDFINNLDINELLSAYGVPLLWAVIIFIVGRIVARIVAKTIARVMTKKGVDETLVKFGTKLLYVALMMFVIIAALDRLGVNTTSFAAVIAAAGLAIGFALQGTLSNFATGIMLIIFRPFKVNDLIEAGGVTGVVEEIQIFTTQLRSLDNKTIIVPNGQMTGGEIVNYSTKDTRRVDLVIGVGYDDDLKKVKSVLYELMNADSRVLADPEPTVGLLELGDNSVNFAVRPWVKSDDYWGVFFDLQEAVKLRFDEVGISIPYPQRDLHIISNGTPEVLAA